MDILAKAVLLLAAEMALVSCASPIGVTYADPKAVHRDLTSNVLSTGQLSESTAIVLHLRDLTLPFAHDPEAAIRSLHDTVAAGDGEPGDLYALAETSFQHAEATGKHPYHLAAAVYALAFLFPEDPADAPSPFDPRFRSACDLYNRALTAGFITADGQSVELRSGSFALPFGTLDIHFDEASARWGDRPLARYLPAANLEIRGLDDRYRQPGLGAPLAAEMAPPPDDKGFQVGRMLKVPVTALLDLTVGRQDLAAGRLRGTLEVYPAYATEAASIGGRPVPLEVERSAALASTLNNSWIWKTEYAGFLRGNLFEQLPSQLVALEPYRRGRYPVIFVHGTASSVGRWANMLNDLQNDPAIAPYFQFWFFGYNTGNPIAYSAMHLRDSITDAVRKLDPAGTDPALHGVVVIGHSQGGLLAKMTAIRTGDQEWAMFSSKPLDQLKMAEEDRLLLRRAVYLEPLPEVRRIIFVATPQKGSFVAGMTLSQWIGRFITLPVDALKATGSLIENNPDTLRFGTTQRRFGSVYAMTPGSPLMQVLSSVPVVPEVAAHSIIAVEGDGPVETGDDGVVAYQSAHIDEAVSEVVVRSGHAVQAHPKAVAEIRRILLLHLRDGCGENGICPRQGGGSLIAEDGSGARALSR